MAGHRCELIGGTLLVTPAPNTRHQRSVARLLALLIGAAGSGIEVLPAPYDWVADPSTLFQPDVLVARRADLGPRRLEATEHVTRATVVGDEPRSAKRRSTPGLSRPASSIDIRRRPYGNRYGSLRNMRQTLVQLTDELVEALDRRAQREGVSRSKVVRDVLDAALSSGAEHDRALTEGYRRTPQSDAADAWGDLDAWTAANGRRNLAALDDEDGGW